MLSNSISNYSIEEIVEQAIKDKHTQVTLYNYALKLTRNVEDAEDLKQDTFTKLWKSRSSIKIDMLKEDKISLSYLSTIMKNTFIDNYRTNKRRFNQLIYIDNLKGDQSTYNYGEGTLIAEEIEKVLASLEFREQDKEIMDFLKQGYQYKDIAEIMSMPLGTVKAFINRTRKFIGQALIETDPEYFTSRAKTKSKGARKVA